MATLTIRNLPVEIVQTLKALAQLHHRSMEQEVRAILEAQAGDRLSAAEQIEQSWATQARSPSAEEVDSWIGAGRK